jgi:hypothetical protein
MKMNTVMEVSITQHKLNVLDQVKDKEIKKRKKHKVYYKMVM